MGDSAWLPRVRVNRIIRDVRDASRDAGQWPVAKIVFRRALTDPANTDRAGWFN